MVTTLNTALDRQIISLRTVLRRYLKIAVALIGTLLISSYASANVIDSIEINRVNDNAQITIHFVEEVQYLRHGPDDEGKFLRVFFRVVKPTFTENEIMQETLRSPPSDLIPRFTVAYPELINGMLISFAKTTKFSVRPGSNSRSILVLVPLPPSLKLQSPVAVLPEKGAASVEPSPAATPPVLPLPSVAQPAAKKGKVPADKKSPKIVTLPPLPVVPVITAAPAIDAGSPGVVQTPDVDKPEAPALLSKESVEGLSRNFLAEAREAFNKSDYPKAVNRLNRILSLPGNSQTEGAQALMGEVREKNGEIAKARAEYELYLKLYPNGSDVPRIKKSLAGLPSAETVRRQTRRPVRDDKPAEWTVYGSVATGFSTGRSQQDSSPMKRDQESLVSSVNLNARLRDSITDTRIVFRDSDSQNFKRENRNYNRIYAAYVERTDREVGYFVRAGRQNPTGGGVLERFDGLTGSYNLGSDWRIGAVAGNGVEFNQAGFSGFSTPVYKKFYGANIELLPQVSQPGGNLYFVEQTLHGFLNRRAIGSEFRYFDGQFSGFGSLDYDLLYKGLNIATAQGNYLDQWGNNYFVSYDYRRSPSYSLANGVYAGVPGVASVSDLVTQVGIDQARKLVKDVTDTASMFGAGVTIPVGDRWQFGGDYRMSTVSGTNSMVQMSQFCKRLDFNDGVDPICIGGPLGDTPISQLCASYSYDPAGDPANNTCQLKQSFNGTTHTFTAQAIGTNLFVANGVGVAMASFNEGPGFSGQNYALNYIFPFAEVWRLESNLRYSTSKSSGGNGQTSFSPSVKLGYQWRSSLFLESEIGVSNQKNTGTSAGENKREYLYVGMRWDYR